MFSLCMLISTSVHITHIEFYLKIFHFLVVEFSMYLNRHVFVMHANINISYYYTY